MQAQPHPDEARRLDALRSYGVLDSETEEGFDDLVALAARICETPISLVSLVDAGRQWFKAAVGTDLRETSVDLSICAHAIHGKGVVEIPDATVDPRTRDNPLVTGEMGIRFYAGAPLETSDGLPLGTLCVVDTKPRQLSELQRETLRVLGEQVMARLELRRKVRELEEEKAARTRDEAFLRLVTDKLPVRVGYLDRDYRYQFVNGAYERAFGYAPGEGAGRTVAEFAGEEAFQIAKPFLDRALSGDTHTQEFTVPYPFGTRRVEVQYVADRDLEGEVRGIVIHVLDVTERYQAAEARREREARYRTLFDSLEEGFCVFEMIFDESGKPIDYRFREINDAFTAQTGLREEDVLGGKTIREMVPTHEPIWFERYGRVATTGEPLFVEDRAEGLGRWYSIHAFRIGGEGSLEVGALFKDITEQRAAQIAIEEERTRQDRTLENAEVATFDWDVAANRVYANPLLARFFGVSETDAVGGPIAHYFGAIHAEDRDRAIAAIGASLASGERYELEYRLTDAQGRERRVLARGDTTLGTDGKPLRLSGVVLDVTAREQAETARRASEQRVQDAFAILESLTQGTQELIVSIDPEYRFTSLNEAYRQYFARVFGTEAKVGGSMLDALAHLPEDQANARAMFDRALGGESVDLTAEFGDPSLGRKTFDVRFYPLRNAAGEIVGAGEIARDVTERVTQAAERERLLTELENERGKLETLFRIAPAFIAVLRGRDLLFEYVNDAYYALVGHRPILGLPLAEAVPEAVGGEEGRDYDRLLLGIMDSGKTVEFSERSVLVQRVPGGLPEERFVDLAYQPLREADGTVSGILVHGIDVTESVRAKVERERFVADLATEREKLDAILALSPAFVAILSGRDLVFDYANPAYRRLLGERSLIGLTLAEAQPEVVSGGSQGQAYDVLLREVIDTGKPVSYTRQTIRFRVSPDAPSEERIVDFTYQPVRDRDGTVTGVLAHGTDVTERALAEREIAQREELFRTVFEQAPDDAIIVIDADRTVTAWNPAAERITGWSADEVIDRPADLLFTPEDRAAGGPEAEIAGAAVYGKTEDERWHVRKDGSRFWGSGTMNALHTEEGRVRGYLKVFRDATERYEETQTLAFLSLLTEAVVDQRDADAILDTAERMIGQYLGTSRVLFAEVEQDEERVVVRKEWTQDAPSILGVHRMSDFGPKAVSDFLSGTTHVSRDADLDYESGKGLEAVRSIEAYAGISVPVMKEGRLSALFVVHNATPRNWTADEISLVQQVADRMSAEIERARAEAALREANQNLEVRVEERTAELQRAVQEAEGFNYSISHDLRTPLRAMVSTASILLEELGPELDEEHRILLGRQAENAKRMGRLIDELLRLSRLARVPVNREPLDMTAKVRSVAEEIAQSGEANGCRFEVQEGMVATGDRGLVRTVLHNLIGNACKFSPRGGTVRMGQDGETFFVRDEGVGFDIKYAPKIFLPFERLVLESEFPGTGIGLANVKRIVERHGGHVWVESAPGKGATFFFTLG